MSDYTCRRQELDALLNSEGAHERELRIWADECAEKIGGLNGFCEETPPIIIKFLRDAFLAGIRTAIITPPRPDASAGLIEAARLAEARADAMLAGSRGGLGSMFADQSATDLIEFAKFLRYRAADRSNP